MHTTHPELLSPAPSIPFSSFVTLGGGLLGAGAAFAEEGDITYFCKALSLMGCDCATLGHGSLRICVFAQPFSQLLSRLLDRGISPLMDNYQVHPYIVCSLRRLWVWLRGIGSPTGTTANPRSTGPGEADPAAGAAPSIR